MKNTFENKDIDIFFDPKPLTNKEKELISEFIKRDKEKTKIKRKNKVHSL